MTGIQPPPAGSMSHHLYIMRKPKGKQDQGTLTGKPKKVGDFWARIISDGGLEFEQLRKQFSKATSVVETYYYEGLQDSDELFDPEKQKLFEIVGKVNVDEMDVLHRIAIVELTK